MEVELNNENIEDNEIDKQNDVHNEAKEKETQNIVIYEKHTNNSEYKISKENYYTINNMKSKITFNFVVTLILMIISSIRALISLANYSDTMAGIDELLQTIEITGSEKNILETIKYLFIFENLLIFLICGLSIFLFVYSAKIKSRKQYLNTDDNSDIMSFIYIFIEMCLAVSIILSIYLALELYIIETYKDFLSNSYFGITVLSRICQVTFSWIVYSKSVSIKNDCNKLLQNEQ